MAIKLMLSERNTTFIFKNNIEILIIITRKKQHDGNVQKILANINKTKDISVFIGKLLFLFLVFRFIEWSL